MKRFECRMLAVKVVLMSVFGLFSLPSLAVVMQWIDSQVGFSGGERILFRKHGLYSSQSFDLPFDYSMRIFSRKNRLFDFVKEEVNGIKKHEYAIRLLATSR